MPKNIPGLLDEHPLVVYPTLAKEIGINKAVMLQQLHFLINVTEAAKNVDHHIDGSWWVYNSYPQWKEDHFPWMGESTIKRFFLELEADGIVKSRQGIKSPTDRRKWYTIDYERWRDYATLHRMIDASPSAQNEPVISSKRANGGLAQNEPVIGSKKSDVIGTETTTETTAEKKKNISPPPSVGLQEVSKIEPDAKKNGSNSHKESIALVKPSPTPDDPATYDDWLTFLRKEFKIGANSSWARNLYNMFKGRARTGAWKENNILPAATLDQVRRWISYEKNECLKEHGKPEFRYRKAEAVNGRFLYWRERWLAQNPMPEAVTS